MTSAQSPCQNESLLKLEENSWKIEIKLFPMCAILHEN